MSFVRPREDRRGSREAPDEGDRSWRPFTEGALSPRDGKGARDELDRLWQGEPAGSRGGCRSPFGVYDMTGNVDEWTRSVSTSGFSSILKGGYWGPVRARCRPATRAHNEDFVAYQQSFRCCAESDTAAPPPVLPVALIGTSGEPSPLPGDAGVPKPTADLSAEWVRSDDEMDALTKARLGLCAARPPMRDGALAPWLALIVAGTFGARRRRR